MMTFLVFPACRFCDARRFLVENPREMGKHTILMGHWRNAPETLEFRNCDWR